MTILLQDVAKTFANQPLFTNLTLQINAGNRVGLVGRNGCGKSTLLRMIMGLEEPDTGQITITPGMQVNYLSQEPRITPELTLLEEMRSVFGEIDALKAEEAELMAKLEIPADDDVYMALVERLSTVAQAIQNLDADSMEARISRILIGLGFSEDDFSRRSGEFSGGWQMRINLAKVLLEGSDFLLLDEPTNHLDLDTCEWMEGFLQSYPGGIVVVSHDRHFLDRTVTSIAELELGQMTLWNGNYSAYVQQKKTAFDNQMAAHERQKKELAKQTAFVERFKASATRGTQAKSREKQLDKIERIEPPKQDHRRMTVRFPSPEPSGREVLTLSDLSKAFGDKQLFKNLNAGIERRQKIFLLGENGAGKTTLLRLVQGLEPPDTGRVETGYHVRLGYFSQNQLETLDPKVSVVDTLRKATDTLDNTEIRSILGRFLFTGEQVMKPVGVLSGGEKSKLALARLMISGHNTLLLDEPTNHMDMPAKEVITEAFKEYDGTMLCISHDRYFIEAVATDIWEIYNGRLITYGGDYEFYLGKRDEFRARFAGKPEKNGDRKSDSASTENADSEPTDHQLHLARKAAQKELARLEKKILKLEHDIETLQQEMSRITDFEVLQPMARELENQQAALAGLTREWDSLTEQLNAGAQA
ncbi:MAG: ABC-F family ATP-binding cassette domain-containing protein [Candidatus Melainabacteria bacterium]